MACVSCGQCIVVCPTGALAEKDNTKDVWRALGDPTKHVIVQTAPSIRVTLGEAFGMHIGTNVEGKMVAALRTAKEWITGESGEAVEFGEVRGTEGIKEASYKIGDLELNVCVASGLKNAKKVLESVKSGEKNYHFIEIMGCPGGCVNGGGQPVQPAAVRNFIDLKARRAAALYEDDKNKPIRKSHENPVVKEVYETYLGSYGSHKAHEILHTSYKKRNRF